MTFPNKLTRHSKEEKHLLRFTYQQIIYLVCTTTKSRETERDSQPDTFEKKKRARAKSELFLNLILWLRFGSMFPFSSFWFLGFFTVWNLAWYSSFRSKTEISVPFPFFLLSVTKVGNWSCLSSCYFGRKMGVILGPRK